MSKKIDKIIMLLYQKVDANQDVAIQIVVIKMNTLM